MKTLARLARGMQRVKRSAVTTDKALIALQEQVKKLRASTATGEPFRRLLG